VTTLACWLGADLPENISDTKEKILALAAVGMLKATTAITSLA